MADTEGKPTRESKLAVLETCSPGEDGDADSAYPLRLCDSMNNVQVTRDLLSTHTGKGRCVSCGPCRRLASHLEIATLYAESRSYFK